MALGAAEGFQILPSPPKPSAVLAKNITKEKAWMPLDSLVGF
jgi:hypothetical protein